MRSAVQDIIGDGHPPSPESKFSDARFTDAWREALPIFLQRHADDELRKAINPKAPDEFICRMMAAIDTHYGAGNDPATLAAYMALLMLAPAPERPCP